MLIHKRRIINLNCIQFLSGENIRVVKRIKPEDVELIQKMGFSDELVIGETILPSIIGAVSRRNAEGYYKLLKNEEKELKYRTIYWHWEQWIGGGRTETHYDYRDIPYYRYKREIFPPYDVELTIAENINGDMVLISPIEICDFDNNSQRIKHVINLFLEYFGECEITSKDLENVNLPKIIRLNWEILPSGERPWETFKEEFKPFLQRIKKGNRRVVESRIKAIESYNPSLRAFGRGGFSGYSVFGFEDKSLFIFESIYTNNATYVFDQNWKEFSSLTKKDIIVEHLHRKRIIHRATNWFKELDELLS